MANKVDIKVQANADVSGLQKTERELKRVAKSADKAKKSATSLGDVFKGTLGAALVGQVGASLKNAATEAISLADHLADLANKAGVSAEALQRIGNAAADNGASVDQVAQAMAKLAINGQKAIDGSKSMQKAFSRVGISLGDIQRSAPDELFLRIADSLKNSNDRGKSFEAIATAMGRSAVDLAATLELGSKGINDLGDSFGVFTEETIKRLDAADQSIAQAKGQIKIATGETIATIVDVSNAFVDADKATQGVFFEAIKNLGNIIFPGGSAARTLGEFAQKAKESGDATEGASPKVKTLKDRIAEIRKELGLTTDETEDSTDALKDYEEAVKAATDAEKARKDAIKSTGDALRDKLKTEIESAQKTLESLGPESGVQTLDQRYQRMDAENRLRELQDIEAKRQKLAPSEKDLSPMEQIRRDAQTLQTLSNTTIPQPQKPIQPDQTSPALGQNTQSIDSALGQKTEEVNQKLGEVVQKATEGFDGLITPIEDLKLATSGGLESVSSKIGEVKEALNNQLTNVSGKIGGITENLPEPFKAVNDSINTMGEKLISGLESIVTGINTSIADHERRIGYLESRSRKPNG